MEVFGVVLVVEAAEEAHAAACAAKQTLRNARQEQRHHHLQEQRVDQRRLLEHTDDLIDGRRPTHVCKFAIDVGGDGVVVFDRHARDRNEHAQPLVFAVLDDGALVALLLHHLVERLELRARRAHQRAQLLAVVGAERRGRARRRDGAARAPEQQHGARESPRAHAIVVK